MGFMDKVKAQAEQAAAKGKVIAEKGMEKSKEGLAQGQAKVKEMQDKRTAEAGKPDAPSGDYKLDDA
jgi:hypothetical protein